MHFSSWLWEQMEEPGRVGYIANICWKDVNNGCANPRFSAPQWMNHLKERHAPQEELLTKLLVGAFKEYMRTLPPK